MTSSACASYPPAISSPPCECAPGRHRTAPPPACRLIQCRPATAPTDNAIGRASAWRAFACPTRWRFAARLSRRVPDRARQFLARRVDRQQTNQPADFRLRVGPAAFADAKRGQFGVQTTSSPLRLLSVREPVTLGAGAAAQSAATRTAETQSAPLIRPPRSTVPQRLETVQFWNS